MFHVILLPSVTVFKMYKSLTFPCWIKAIIIKNPIFLALTLLCTGCYGTFLLFLLDGRSSQCHNLASCKKNDWKKKINGGLNRIQTLDSVMPVQRPYQVGYQANWLNGSDRRETSIIALRIGFESRWSATALVAQVFKLHNCLCRTTA